MNSNERLVYDIAEAAKILGIGRNAAYEAAKRGELPVVRVGKLLRVPKAALHRMLEQATAVPPARD
jgi:excisionase family DNA binding protein